MNIKKLIIKNFRGFDFGEFEFDPHVNVIVGNNTAGKTTILHAVQIALGAYLQSLSLLPQEKMYRRNFVATDRVLDYNESKQEFVKRQANPFIGVEADMPFVGKKDGAVQSEVHHIKWYREARGNTTLHARKNVGELLDIVNTMDEYRRSDDAGTNVVLPLVAAFGADRIDNNYKVIMKTVARESRVAKGYKSALSESVDFKSALDWIYKYNSGAKMLREFDGTDRAFFSALETAAKLCNIYVDHFNKDIWADVRVTGQPQRRLSYSMMSDGFKAMINLVAEIAYRCIMLNGFLGEQAVKETTGVVLIDEIDIFLHPHWQQHVLADLQAAFPKIQFIVTTHSPFIVQSVDRNNVITLDGVVDPKSPSNRGIEEIAVSEMGMEGLQRSQKYRDQLELAEKYYNLIKDGREGKEAIDKVRQELEELELQFDLFHDPAYEAFLKIFKGNL